MKICQVTQKYVIGVLNKYCSVHARFCTAFDRGNVIFVDTEVAEIREIAEKIIYNEEFSNSLKNCKPVYGKGNTAQRIIKYLQRLNKTRMELIAKGITY